MRRSSSYMSEKCDKLQMVARQVSFVERMVEISLCYFEISIRRCIDAAENIELYSDLPSFLLDVLKRKDFETCKDTFD